MYNTADWCFVCAAIANSSNEDVVGAGMQQQQPLIGRYPGAHDRERAHRANPLDAFDTRDVSGGFRLKSLSVLSAFLCLRHRLATEGILFLVHRPFVRL